MSKHTPGPWRAIIAKNGQNHDYAITSDARGQADSRVGWANVRLIAGDASRDEEAAANARLIASAPELLAACKRELITSHCICHYLRRVATSDKDDTTCDHCKLVAVVNKAEGLR